MAGGAELPGDDDDAPDEVSDDVGSLQRFLLRDFSHMHFTSS